MLPNRKVLPVNPPGSIPNLSRIELKTTYCYYVIVFGSAFCLAQSPLTAPFSFQALLSNFQLLIRNHRFPDSPILDCVSVQLNLYSTPVNRLTKQEQLVICIIAGLLLLGWAVKTYRIAHPPAQTAEKSKS
jgi:hypothetical protein